MHFKFQALNIITITIKIPVHITQVMIIINIIRKKGRKKRKRRYVGLKENNERERVEVKENDSKGTTNGFIFLLEVNSISLKIDIGKYYEQNDFFSLFFSTLRFLFKINYNEKCKYYYFYINYISCLS